MSAERLNASRDPVLPNVSCVGSVPARFLSGCLFVLLRHGAVKAEKVPMFGAYAEKRKRKMSKIITVYELQNLTHSELYGLQRKTRNELTRSVPGSAERRNALASLENITGVVNSRAMKPAFK